MLKKKGYLWESLYHLNKVEKLLIEEHVRLELVRMNIEVTASFMTVTNK